MHTLPVYALNFEILEFSAASETHFKRDICGLDHYASEPFNCRMVPKVLLISLFADFPTLLNAYSSSEDTWQWLQKKPLIWSPDGH